ncbi:hypothetical protein [Streptomyces sp. NPDC096311]|uniref:hypothetical protein n=1 Tax=Streptomyces sp. NPDC096311 TaxID=3366083 RepID=UPI00382F0C5B
MPRTGGEEVVDCLGDVGAGLRPLAVVGQNHTEYVGHAVLGQIDVVADLDERVMAGREGFRAPFSRWHLRSTVFASVFWGVLVLPYVAIGTFWTRVFAAPHRGDGAVAALLVCSFTAVAGVTWTTWCWTASAVASW